MSDRGVWEQVTYRADTVLYGEDLAPQPDVRRQWRNRIGNGLGAGRVYWTAASSGAWIAVTAGGTGNGAGTVAYR